MDDGALSPIAGFGLEPPSDKPALRLWLRLLTCANLIEGAVRTDLRAAFGATLPRFDLLAQLDRAPAGLTMGQLSRRLMVSNGNVTGVVDRLVAEGLVQRQAGATDRRVQVVRLTTAGRQGFARMAAAHEHWIGGLFAGLARDEVDQLMALLGRLKESVKARAPAPEGAA